LFAPVWCVALENPSLKRLAAENGTLRGWELRRDSVELWADATDREQLTAQSERVAAESVGEETEIP
jgi:hypothetical protein